MVIKHIVISGGGPSAFSIISCLKYLHVQGMWSIDHIESIYGCSSGAWLGLFISFMKLGLTIDEIENYLINRSWKTLAEKNVYDFKTAFDNKGIFDLNVVKRSIEPLLKAIGLPIEITFKELFDLTKITIVFNSVDINCCPFKKILLSHKTFPDLPIYQALTSSMAVPFLIAPVFIDNMCLVDGGLLSNFLYYECKEGSSANDDEILGFKTIQIKNESEIENEKSESDQNETVQSDQSDQNENKLNTSSNMIDFMAHLIKNMALHIFFIEQSQTYHSKNICLIPNHYNLSVWVEVFTNKEQRIQYMNHGIEYAKSFILKLENENKTEIISTEEKNSQTPQEYHT